MNESIIVHTSAADGATAGRQLAESVKAGLRGGGPPDAAILFASPRYEHEPLLREFARGCAPRVLVGASSAGEFTTDSQGDALACVLALRSDEMTFASGVGGDLSVSRREAAEAIAVSFRGTRTENVAFPFRSALVLTDALAGHADELVEQLTLATSGKYQFFGGGAGDDAKFRRTLVFHGTEVLRNAAVALEILSQKPIGIGVDHGWVPAGSPMRVTEARGATVLSLNGLPAVDAFVAHARATNQTFDPDHPLPFFLHNVVGIDTGQGHRLRVPLAVQPGGGILCAAEIPVGAKIHIMRTTSASAAIAATRATRAAVKALEGTKPKVAIFFDCVATRLRLGDSFGLELDVLAREIGPLAEYVGCNTHGQIARAPGQFGGFHNCTAVVCVLPE